MTPTTQMDLSANHIHVWQLDLEVDADRLAQLRATLAADEMERADRFYFERDRVRFAAGRGLLREILGHYLAIPPARLAFAYNQYGKPSLTGDHTDALSFNLSHSGAMGLVAVRLCGELGVDLEEYRPGKGDGNVAEQYFSPREVVCLRAVPEALRTRAFLNCWTRKEAYIKARGMGLSIPLDSFDVTLTPGEPAALLRTADPADRNRWRLRDLALGDGLVGAIVAAGRDWTFELIRWREADERLADGSEQSGYRNQQFGRS
jgi:4'-phosphopantetheinyl transferase